MAALFGADEVLAVGGVLGTAAMALALLPRSTRELGRYEPPAPGPGVTPVVVAVRQP